MNAGSHGSAPLPGMGVDRKSQQAVPERGSRFAVPGNAGPGDAALDASHTRQDRTSQTPPGRTN